MKKRNKKLTENEISDILNMYENDGMSSVMISKKMGLSKGVVLKYLKINNIFMKPPKKYRNYEINDNFFSNVEEWGEAQSYIYGFIMGDGYNNPNLNKIKVTLAKKDKEILELINSKIQNKPINIENKNGEHRFYSMFIFSPQISQDLLNLGINSNKTIECHFPKFLNDENMRHFVRGLIDADGSFSLYKNKYIKFDFSGNEYLCRDILNFLQERLNIKGNVYKDKRSKICHQTTFFGTKNIIPIYRLLYENCDIFLKRKKAVCDDFFIKNHLSIL